MALLAVLAAAPSARADAIDGECCSPKGQNLMIDGPKIRIPSGVEIQGKYRRHEFVYQPPVGEDHAGEIAYLNILSDEEMLFRWIKDGAASEPETWKRCNVTS